MKYLVQNIKLPIEASKDEVFAVAKQRLLKFFSDSALGSFAIHKQSVDARKNQAICFVYSVAATVDGAPSDESAAMAEGIRRMDSDVFPILFGTEPLSSRPVIVGFGPCGMFAALLLAENGYRPIVIERGAPVEERTEDVARFRALGILDPESNVQFGAGGAGTFSDGKLMTRIGDAKCAYVLSELHRLGAPEEILTAAKPHIGTDNLISVVQNATNAIRALGGDILFHTKMTDFKTSGTRVTSILTNRGEIPCGALLLALGHSARDTFGMLRERGLSLVSKPFSVGVRIEHLQEDIDRGLYGALAGHPLLPKGEYALSAHDAHGRGVYTFCMCPGGEVVASSSEEGGVVTNGMSRYRRDGVNANSAVAVSVSPADIGETVEQAIAFQRTLEQRAFALGGRNYDAPCETVGDFLGRTKHSSPARVLPSYRGGRVKLAPLSSILPDFVSETLRFGLADFGRKLRGFDANDAVLTGLETRTSSPVRILRGALYTAEPFENLYPCGEGAGYAGGITSAAVDGLHGALALMRRYQKIQ